MRERLKMTEIALKAGFSAPFSLDEVRRVVDSALRREADLAEARRAYFARQCSAFEQKHEMISSEFMERFESGALGDDLEYFDWYAAKRGLDLWERRVRILAGIKV
jgi:hypothetical protein